MTTKKKIAFLCLFILTVFLCLTFFRNKSVSDNEGDESALAKRDAKIRSSPDLSDTNERIATGKANVVTLSTPKRFTSILGKVRDVADRPVGEAEIKVYDNRNEFICGTTTDQDGAFKLKVTEIQNTMRVTAEWSRPPTWNGNVLSEHKHHTVSLFVNWEAPEIDLGVLRLENTASESIIAGEVVSLDGQTIQDLTVNDGETVYTATHLDSQVFIKTVGDKFWIYGLPEGDHDITVSAKGHAEKVVRDISVGHQEVKMISVTLDHGAELMGYIKDSKGYPVKGEVRLTSTLSTIESHADEMGFFNLTNIGASGRHYEINVSGEGYYNCTIDLPDDYFTTRTSVVFGDIILLSEAEAGVVEGTVLTRNIQTGNFATLKISNRVNFTKEYQVGNNFRLDNIPPGQYDFLAKAQNHVPIYMKNVKVEPARSTKINIEFREGLTVSGYVKDRDTAQLLQGVEIILLATNADGVIYTCDTITVDSQGYFISHSIPYGKLTIVVRGKGYKEKISYIFAEDKTSYNIELEADR